MVDKLIYSPEAEQAILAYILRYPGKFTALYDILKPADFGWRAFGDVWGAMRDLNERGLVMDTVTVGDELERNQHLEDFCLPGQGIESSGKVIQFHGRAALSQLRDVQTPGGTGETYALTVSDYANKRELRELANRIAMWSSNGRTAASIISDVECQFSKMVLHSGKVNNHTIGMDLAVSQALAATERASKGEKIKTGLIDLDKIVGVQKQELITIAARPGQGKTALLCTIILNMARAGKRCLFFSVEMSGVSITQRLISQLSGISGFRIMNGNIFDSEQDKFQEAADELSELPITICDLPAIRIGQIRTEARKNISDFIALDYIQLANADNKNDRRDLDIGEVTRGLKALAKELDTPIFSAAQLGRGSETNADKKPQLKDLRESGSIENDSDTVIFIYNKSDFDPHELIVAKHRNGPVGSAKTYFHKDTMRFSDAVTHNVDFNREDQ